MSWIYCTYLAGQTVLTAPAVTSCGLFHQDSVIKTASSACDRTPHDAQVEHNDLLEQHTSAAKDGVIEMLTTKGSKLAVALERAKAAKRETEDSLREVQVRVATRALCYLQRVLVLF